MRRCCSLDCGFRKGPKVQTHDAVQDPVGYDAADPQQNRGVASDGVASPGTGCGRGLGDHFCGVFGRNAGLDERSGLCRDGRGEIVVACELGGGHVGHQPLRGRDSTLGHLGLDRAGFDDDDLDPEHR